MGLKAKGDHGVKAVLKRDFSGAFHRCDTVEAATAACRRDRSQVCATVDGNVLMMQTPQDVESFVDYANILTAILRSKVRAAAVVVVVFDEPEVLTAAKREEQEHRDARRTKPATYHSADLPKVPVDDAYDHAQLLGVRNCHEIVGSRPARSRFFDAVGVEVRRRLENELTAAGAVVVFDGLDPRGADRPAGAARDVQLFGAGVGVEEVVAALHHPPIGEGDMKLAVIEECVRRVAARPEAERPAPLRAVCVHFAVTIDTDSLAIGLLERARRDVETPTRAPFQTAMLMRERAPKRDRWGDEANASYLLLDYDALYLLVQKYLWDERLSVIKAMDPVQKRQAITLLVGGWILAGSDYAEIRGLTADMITAALPGILRHSAHRLGVMQTAWGRNAGALQFEMPPALAHLVRVCLRNYEEAPRARKATILDLQSYDDVQLRRAAWCVAYWSGWEVQDDLHEFGFYRL